MTDAIAQNVAVSFARSYYTAVVEQPSQLQSFYAPTASVRHLNQLAVKGSGSELAELLDTISFGRVGVRKVELSRIEVAGTVSGNIKVTIAGTLRGSGAVAASEAGQPFKQDLELRAVAERTYAITSDVLFFESADAAAAAGPAVSAWALETPPMFAKSAAEAPSDFHQPATTAEKAPAAAGSVATDAPETAPVVSASASDAAAATAAGAMEETAPKEAAAATAPAEVPKAPTSFAEALKASRSMAANDTAKKPAAAPVRVTAKASAAAIPTRSGTTASAAAGERKPRAAADGAAKPERPARKPDGSATAASAAAGAKHPATVAAKKRAASATTTTAAAGAADKRRVARPAGTSAPVVFYDVIIKGLPAASTEAAVRAMLPADIKVSLVKVESKAARSDPTDSRTFAFVQVDAAALKVTSVERKDAIARIVSEGNAKKVEGSPVVFEEVHEKKKYTARPAGSTAGATVGRTPGRAPAATAVATKA